LQNKFNGAYNKDVEPVVFHLMLVVIVILSKLVSTFDNPNHTKEKNMKKLASVVAGLLLCASTTVFAAGLSDKGLEHVNTALEHANAAVVHGKAGHAPVLVEHAKSALNHTLSASLVAKGVPKTHIDAAADSLQKSIDEGELGHAPAATKAAEAGVEHLNASKQ
jgi:hypothetical protein